MLTYEIDTSDVKLFISRMTYEYGVANAEFWETAKLVVQSQIIFTISELSLSAGKGFPPQYTQHLISVINANPPIRNTGFGLEVDFNMLGSYEDYAEGFHRHAQIEGGGMVELPYSGEPLKTDDPSIRGSFWEALAGGVAWESPKGGAIKTDGMWEATIADRIAVWGSRAPEWWVLQNGSEYEPKVNPTPLAEVISNSVRDILASMYDARLQEAVNRADHSYNAPLAWHGGGESLGLKPGFSMAASGRSYWDVRDVRGRFRKA